MKTCETDNKAGLSEIKYGEDTKKDICWKLSDSASDSKKLLEAEYTEFFKENGAQKGIDWRGGLDSWGTQQCIGNGAKAQGAITNPKFENGEEYIGLCEGSNVGNTKFVKKMKSRSQDEKNNYFSLGICNNECGNEGKIVKEVKTLNKETPANGNEVKFYV